MSYRVAGGLVAIALAVAGPAAGQAVNVTYHVEILQTEGAPPELLPRLRPLKTLQQVEDLLKANSIPFSWRRGSLVSERITPQFAQALARLPPGEVFAVPRLDKEGLIIGVILDRK